MKTSRAIAWSFSTPHGEGDRAVKTDKKAPQRPLSGQMNAWVINETWPSLLVAMALIAGCGTGAPPPPVTDGFEPDVVEVRPGVDADGTQEVDAAPEPPVTALSGQWRFGTDRVDVKATDEGEGRRRYWMSSTHPMRDDGPTTRSFTEAPGDPTLRSGVLLTDALFAMAVDDARLNAVTSVSDPAFSDARPCECYQTGELWQWVWTRDIAYATDLGLAWLDPERSANSLLFKLSPRKTGGPQQIVQDTGSGGSWPVSTDRVTWARGAMAVLRVMDHPTLRAAAIEAMTHTATLDRLYAFDARDGLYRGESSFLDWRAQSYPAWMAENVVHIGMSKSLSTNLGHLFLLRSLESLTGESHQAETLALAIDAAFWDGTKYRSFVSSDLDPGASDRQDLLSTSLAVIDLGTHPEALAAYPFGAFGPPVMWPQEPLIPIYHNRGIWPFVTAYSVLAARAAGNGAVMEAGLDSLIRGAALNLSHMENLELASGANWVSEGATSGPVINSRRQLWSVAGFLGAVAHGVFGVRAKAGTLSASPTLPGGPWFKEGGSLSIGSLTASIGVDAIQDGEIATLGDGDWKTLFAARVPSVDLNGLGEGVTLHFSGDAGATFDVYRDGLLVDANVGSPWQDTTPTTACYAVVARLLWPSHRSEPTCWWGDDYQRIQSVPASDFSAVGGVWSEDHGRGHYGHWGSPSHTLAGSFTPNNTGEHLLQCVFGNGAGPVESGITAAVKWLSIRDPTGWVVAEGPVLMPQGGTWDWRDSNFVRASLTQGVLYDFLLSDGFNMSYLAHYEDYVGGRGGGPKPSNDVNISELKVLFMHEGDIAQGP